MSNQSIAVYADWSPGIDPMALGTLEAHGGKSGEVFSFEFSDAALNDAHLLRQHLDPDLDLFAGPQYPRDRRVQFGIFSDSSPDRWGRRLIDRNFARRRRTGELPPRARPAESDYLLGVHDEFRSGALRYKLDGKGEFFADDMPSAAPPLVRLRELEAASRALEGGADQDPQLDAQLMLLLAPGASLGGARPKATVSDPDGNLWIAKFPSQNDRYDTGAWEYVVHQLAHRSGIRVSEAQVRRFSNNGHTFLVRRFDREGVRTRIHYASAMTLTGHVDGDDASYLEIADVIASQGAEAKVDLMELWTRIAFNVLISNTDDHLRNHGFLLTSDGWRLAPAFDMNPNPLGTGLALDIDESDNALNLDLVRSVADYFRVSDAESILDNVHSAISTWHDVARRLELSRAEQDNLAAAFRN
jgi:serine/threonine-protein kinase HipA